jgi:dGTPase
VNSSDGRDHIRQSEEARRRMSELRAFMFERVYRSTVVKKDSELDKIRHLIFSLYDFYEQNTGKLPPEQQAMMGSDGVAEVVKDHIASMTDRYAINVYTANFVPAGWKK